MPHNKFKFLAPETSHYMNIFDLDDTLVVTDSKIKVTDIKTQNQFEITPQEFNYYNDNSNHKLDFSDFENVDNLKAGILIDEIFNKLIKTLKYHRAVGIVTARGSSVMVRDFLLFNGVDINPKFIFAVGDWKGTPNSYFTGTTEERKKQAMYKFIEMGFRNFRFWDDSAKNLELVKTIEKEIPNIKITTKLVTADEMDKY